MRLLRSKPGGDFKLITFNADDVPPYAALSHTWTEGEEVTYDEFVAGKSKNKAGYAKLQFCGERATKDGVRYFWVDTCCIHKRDNSELNTALNSMFRWYQRATKCYVYLSDVHVLDEVVDAQAFRITWEDAFRRSRWFTQGWTLQELLAPASVEFFSANGRQLGSKITLEQEIHEITQIPIRALRNYDLREFSVSERMNWAAGRRTKVKEDKAYCLLGIFNVFLPLIYAYCLLGIFNVFLPLIYSEGEEHAFRRLKKEIPGQAESLGSLTAAKAQKVSASSQLPFPRNEFFVGREDHLRILQERLCPSHTHKRMSIYGLGGGGKTAVALELAYRMMAKHSLFLVLWVPAISRETFEIACREIGTLLRIPGITDDNASVKQLVKNSLNSGNFGDWLMVVDNADNPSVLLDSSNDDRRAGRLYDYLPYSDRGSIVFTTRDRKVAERLTQSSVLELEDMTKAETKQLMARRIMKGTLLDDQSATNELLKLLTYLPLAIVQAVAFINSNQVSISDYLLLFKRLDTEVEILSEREDVADIFRPDPKAGSTCHEISVIMACIDRINIPQSLLPVEGTPVQRFKALGTLTGYAFITERQQNFKQIEGGRLFNVHRLVQKATVRWLKDHDDWTAWTAWTETAYGRLEELVPYADLCSTLSETRKASLLDRIGRCQATLGQYAIAEETHRRVLSLRKKNVGIEEASTLTSMNQVALALNDQGKYKEAEAIYKQALALKENVLSKEHPDTLTSIYNLGSVLYSQGKYEEAEAMNRQTLALKAKVLGKEHPDTLGSMNNLALELALYEKVLGKEHPDTLTSMSSLASVLRRQGKYEEAEAMHRQSLAVREKILGKDHPDTLISVYCLEHLLAKRDLYDEATTLYQRACDGYSVALRDDHPTALACQQHYLDTPKKGAKKQASKDESADNPNIRSRLSRGLHNRVLLPQLYHRALSTSNTYERVLPELQGRTTMLEIVKSLVAGGARNHARSPHGSVPRIKAT
ncbi:hypothetical protein V491_00164 [Pseudogymnoascus sp. VKM F-3775]|nr:hypothetical protein V491_00164 [Pseudogymnoascus sp. VKM F-3775]